MKASDIALVSLFTSLTVMGAYAYLPLSFTPVPITFQTLFVYLSGTLLKTKRGALSQLLYILLGLIGLPVFAGGKAGFMVILGPTGGYLISFPISAFIIGSLIKFDEKFKDNVKRFAWYIFVLSIGTLIIYLIGVLQLSYWIGGDLIKSIALGILPFIPGDVIKIIIASVLTIKLKPITEKLLNF